MDLSIFVYHRCQQNHDSTRRLKRIALSFKQAEAQASSAFTFDSMLRMERTFFDSPAQNVSQDSISINENKTYDNYERKTLVRRAVLLLNHHTSQQLCSNYESSFGYPNFIAIFFSPIELENHLAIIAHIKQARNTCYIILCP